MKNNNLEDSLLTFFLMQIRRPDDHVSFFNNLRLVLRNKSMLQFCYISLKFHAPMRFIVYTVRYLATLPSL